MCTNIKNKVKLVTNIFSRNQESFNEEENNYET